MRSASIGGTLAAARTTSSVCSGSARTAANSRRNRSSSSLVGSVPRQRRWAAASKLTRPASSLSS